MGLLDSKSRVLDTLITEEGRIQLSQGRMRISHVAFSDASTFYEYDAVSGSSDATSRLYFEAMSLPHDEVTFQADDAGRLKPFSNTSGVNVISGKIVSGSAIVPSDGQQFASLAGKLLATSGENFNKLRVIGTVDEIFDDKEFELSATSVEFIATRSNPVPKSLSNRRAADLPSLFHDPRLSHLPNFALMPPVIRGPDQVMRPLGPPPPAHVFASPSDFARAHMKYASQAIAVGAGKSIKMDPTSRNNNVMMQMFEVGADGTLTKLDAIRFDDPLKPGRPTFFVGKIVIDGDEYKFFNLFTLVME